MKKYIKKNLIIIFLFNISFLCSVCSAVKENKKPAYFKAEANTCSIGVYIYSDTIKKYNDNFRDLTETVDNIGINEVYLSFSDLSYERNKVKYKEKLNKLIRLFHKKNIDVAALSFGTPTLIFDKNRLREKSNNITEYNASSPKTSRFDAVTADLEPHMLKEHSRWKDKTSIYWTKNGYRTNNLKLLEKTFSALKNIKAGINKMPLSEAVPTFYLKHFGTADNMSLLAKYNNHGCDYVILMVYSNNFEKIVRFSKKALRSTEVKNSVVICVKTGKNTSGGGGSKTTLSGMNRDEFVNKMNNLIKLLNKYKSFRGISFFEFEGFIDILNIPGQN
ncbi:MAG: hypothetical protein K9M56_08165 [Victivallales bacterium]|nr:hypothetical protein [Victivallales bacterium]